MAILSWASGEISQIVTQKIWISKLVALCYNNFSACIYVCNIINNLLQVDIIIYAFRLIHLVLCGAGIQVIQRMKPVFFNISLRELLVSISWEDLITLHQYLLTLTPLLSPWRV